MQSIVVIQKIVDLSGDLSGYGTWLPAADPVHCLLFRQRDPTFIYNVLIFLFQFYKYSAYDLDKPFLIQFEDNQNELLNSLSQLINKSKSI